MLEERGVTLIYRIVDLVGKHRLSYCAIPFAMFLLFLNISSAQDPGNRWELDHGGIIRGDIDKKQIALVFTGGEYGEGCDPILETLDQFQIRASFFVTGHFLGKTEFRTCVNRILNEGHYLGPHSDGHLLYCSWEDRSKTLITKDTFTNDLLKNIKDLKKLGAFQEEEPIFFIPPYEWFNHDQVEWAKELGIILFNFTPGTGSNRDWAPISHPSYVPSRKIIEDILSYELNEPSGLNGFILLLHLGAEREDKAFHLLGDLLSTLQIRGYTFIRIDEMLEGIKDR